jgi:hypothetical protein
MLCIMAARVAVPFGQRVSGRVLLEHRLSARERLLLHRHSLYALGFVLLLGAVSGAIPRGLELAGVLGALAITLGLPAVYRFTDRGVGLNGVVFRTWEEFTGVDDIRYGLRLDGRAGVNRFTVICLPGSARDRLRRLMTGRLRRLGPGHPRGNGRRGALRRVAQQT